MFACDTVFKATIKLNTFVGFLSVGNVKKTKSGNYRFLITLGLFVLFCMFLIQIVCVSIVLAFKYDTGDSTDTVCILAMLINSCLLILFYTLKGNEVAENYDTLAVIVDELLGDPTSRQFQDSVMKSAFKINNFVKFSMFVNNVLLFLQSLVKALDYLKFAELVPEHGVPFIYNMPWKADNYNYWPTLILESISSVFIVSFQQANLYYVLTMTIMQALCFQHLKRNLDYIITSLSADSKKTKYINAAPQLKLLEWEPLHKEKSLVRKTDESQPCDQELKCWIETHNRLIKVCKEFIVLYTPLLVVYFVLMFTILTVGMFSVSQNQQYFGLAENILLGLYFSGVIVTWFVLSYFGTNLNLESSRTFENVFHAPWYNCEEEIKSNLKIIGIISKRPIVLTPFGSTQFEMTLDTFIWVMRTMLSFCIALFQMKEMGKANQPAHQFVA